MRSQGPDTAASVATTGMGSRLPCDVTQGTDDVGSKETLPHRRHRSTSATTAALVMRFTREVTTPRSRATAAPGYPSRFKATRQNIFRVRTASRFRSAPRILAGST